MMLLYNILKLFIWQLKTAWDFFEIISEVLKNITL